MVMIVDIKLIDNIPHIEKITSLPGRYISKREEAAPPESSGNEKSPQLFVLDSSWNVIYQEEFEFPEFITIPMSLPGTYDLTTPPLLRIIEPEVSIVVPFFTEAAFVRVFNSQGSGSSAIKKIEQMNLPYFSFLRESGSRESERFHVLLMASNYNLSNMANFTTTANSLKQFLLTREPFSFFSSNIDVNIYANTTNLGCYSGCNGIDRLICCETSKVIAAAASSGYLYDEIIVIHNTNTYGGGGYRETGDAYKRNSYNTYAVTYSGTWHQEVGVHEFGHSFGNLCDEYTYGTENYMYSDCVNCRASCNDWVSISNACQASCDARNDYYRPEDSIMIYLANRYFNKTSIKATYFPDGLEKRLNFFMALLYPPLNFRVERKENNLIFFKEYYNQLNWEENPDNLAPIKNYKLFSKSKGSDDSLYTQLAVLEPDIFVYYHRNLKKDELLTYKIISVDTKGRESYAAVVSN